MFVNKDAPALQGDALAELVSDLQDIFGRLQRQSRKYPVSISELLLRLPPVTEEMLHSQSQMEHWGEALHGLLSGVDSTSTQVSLTLDAEHQIWLPQIQIMLKGVTEQVSFTQSFFSGQDYAAMAGLINKLDGLLDADAYVQRGEKTLPVEHFVEAYNWLISEARRGLDIQRYKGLGEMNPDQLWETTMDPEVRRMLQVTVADAIGADQMFTTLMGDQVEPRREFIEANALSVVNLDV